MNTTLTDETILKTDMLGRVKMPLARREQLLDEFERSGLSGQKFAAVVGVKYPTFATWAQCHREWIDGQQAVLAAALLRALATPC